METPPPEQLPPPSLSPQQPPPPAAPPPPPPAWQPPAPVQPPAEPSTLYGGPPPPPPPPYPAGYSYGYGPPPNPDGPAPGLRYAGFGVRTVAYIIDVVLIFVVVLILSPALGGLTQQSTVVLGNTVQQVTTLNSSVELFQVLLGAIYFVGLWTFAGRTLGMMATHLRVLRAADGRPLGLGQAVIRYIGLLISFAVILLGVIWVAIDPRRQGWHDKMASSFVVQEISPV